MKNQKTEANKRKRQRGLAPATCYAAGVVKVVSPMRNKAYVGYLKSTTRKERAEYDKIYVALWTACKKITAVIERHNVGAETPATKNHE